MTPIDERKQHHPHAGDIPQPGSGAAPTDDYADAGGPVGDVDPEEIIAHAERLDQLEASVEEWKSKYQRALADFQNFQRRSVENEREARRQGVTSVVAQLLGVLDNFDLALRTDSSGVSVEQIAQGVRLIRQQLLQALGAIDVSRIEPGPGDEFDPHRHEAVAQAPSHDIEPGRVAATFQAGYRLGERVLRPAKVSVAKPVDAEQGSHG